LPSGDGFVPIAHGTSIGRAVSGCMNLAAFLADEPQAARECLAIAGNAVPGRPTGHSPPASIRRRRG
jgi:hypothetical protein